MLHNCVICKTEFSCVMLRFGETVFKVDLSIDCGYDKEVVCPVCQGWMDRKELEERYVPRLP